MRGMVRRFAAGLCAGVAVLSPALFSVSPATASTTVIPYDSMIDGPWQSINGTNRLAQSFTTGATAVRLTSVGAWLRNDSGGATSYTITVRESSPPGVPGNVVATVVSNVSMPAWGDTQASNKHDLATPVELSPNTTYFVVATGGAGGTPVWKCSTTAISTDVSPRPTFTTLQSADSGNNWVAPSGGCAGRHLSMKVWTTARSTPTLSNFTNVSAALGDAAVTITPPTVVVPGTFSYTSSDVGIASVTGNQLVFAGVGTATVTATFSPTDPANYTTATISMTVTVAAAPTTTTTSTTTTTTTTTSSTTTTTTTVSAVPTTSKPPRTTTTSPNATAARTTTTTAPPTTTTSGTTATTVPSSTVPSSTVPPTTVPPTTVAVAPTVSANEVSANAPSNDIFSDTEATQAVMRIEAEPGDTVDSVLVFVESVGLAPGAPITVTVYSEPTKLLEATADATGNFSATLRLPSDLAAGRHTLVLSSRNNAGPIDVVGTVTVDDAGLVDGLVQPAAVSNFEGPGDERVERAAGLGKPIYDPRSRPLTTASVIVAATSLLALAGAAGVGSSMPSSGRVATRTAGGEEQRRRNSRGKLAGAVTKKLKGLQVDGEARGDAGRTWRVPGTARADALSCSLPNKIGKWSALGPRIVVDGSWLRAIFGSFGWIAWLAGLGIGLAASFVDTRSPLTPATGFILVIAALGILDAGAGAVAWLTLVVVAAVTGNIAGWPDVRTALGLGLVFATVPLLAHVIRPLRRFVRGNDFERWERVFDYVMMPVFVAFATGSMLKALNGLSGLEIVDSHDISAMRWTVAIMIVVRLAVEDVAAHHFPKRMAEVQPKKLVSPNRRVTSVSIAVRSLVFLMVAEPFFGLNIRTIAAAVLLAIPNVMKMWEDELPNSTAINKWLPRGLFRFLCTLIIGAYLTAVLIGTDGGDTAVRSSFIWMLIPGVVLGVVELFGRSGGDWPSVRLKRSLGALVWVTAAGIVTGNIILFA